MPEPATMTLLAIGLGAVGLGYRKKLKANRDRSSDSEK